jgi:hypothetical protein
LALQGLGLGYSTEHLNAPIVRDWLDTFKARTISYPNVAKQIADWIARGNLDEKDDLIETLWAQTDCHGLPGFEPYRREIKSRANAARRQLS